MSIINIKRRPLYLAVAASLAVSPAVLEAQEEAADIAAPAIEEVLVLGRLKSSADSILDERLEQPFSADLLGSEQISRTGDSTVAAALVRVTGVTLIEDQYVYVRSLGERYSSTLLNGAAVPSPELTRNVLPLDIIPSSIVESLKIQKAWSPDLPANFGGGNIDIRTKSVPEDLVFTLGLGTGTHSKSSENGLFTARSSEGMPQEIRSALDTYAGGTLEVNQIQRVGNVDINEARRINRDLALSLDRDIEIQEKSHPLDYSLSLDLGNAWDITDDITLGAIVSLARDDESRNKNFQEKGVGAPDQTFSDNLRSVDEVQELGSLNAGLKYQDNHTVSLNSYFIRNTEDDAQIERGHNGNNLQENGERYVRYSTRHEERELVILQGLGEHTFDQLSGDRLGDIQVDWFVTDSEATTDIPQKTEAKGIDRINPETGELISTSLLSTSSMASFSFLNLEDRVRSRGLNLHAPFSFGKAEITLSSGYSYNDKSREYFGYTANINSLGVSPALLAGTPGSVLNNANLADVTNSFSFSMGTGLGKESYLAAQITDAAYGMLDFTWDYTWRITAGARYENFRQALLPIDLLNYSYVGDLVEDLEDPEQNYALQEDDWYPSLAVTYMNEGFMGTENFQVRASVSQSVVRPDLREKSEVAFFNEDNIRVYGNPALLNSEIDHIDLRGEWYFPSGDNFTVSVFYKDILNPIEQSRRPGSDDDLVLDFYNAESGEIYGIELEALKAISGGFFLSGNLTLSDSEIVSGAGQGFTNIKRAMTGQSEYVLNTQLGYDSDDGLHSASLVYNVFGERVYYAARIDGHDDAFEQPFNSLDLVYSYYPTEAWTVKLKANNLLNEKRSYEQVNSNDETVTILEREVGTGLSLDLSYAF